jgi:hypothetical protein
VGRRRAKDLKLLSGVRPRGRAWYWQPTSEKERLARRARGEKVEIRLGPAGSVEARRKWAEVTGLLLDKDTEGLVLELLNLWELDPGGLPLQANGERRADSTIEQYRRELRALADRFGRCRYGRTVDDAARDRAIGTVLIQEWVDEHQRRGLMKRQFAVLDNVFTFAMRKGRTTYNPCADVALPLPGVREREPLPWEVECLRTSAPQRLGLMMDFEGICGWRVGDMLAMVRAQGTADGVRVRYRKRGKRHVWEWTPELRRIWRETEDLTGATRFPLSPVFPSRTGRQLSYEGFDAQWQDLKRATNALLADGIVDPDTFAIAPGLVIEDLHFHDLRSKAGDDAEDAGHEMHKFLGNSASVANRHYRRREQRRRPLK